MSGLQDGLPDAVPRGERSRQWWRRQLERPSSGVGGRVAAWLTRRLGTTGALYASIGFSAVWMVLGAREVLGFDPFPYPLLLLVGNLAQLLLGFVILVGQRILGAAGEQRALQTYSDAQAILAECHRLQEHIDHQNLLLNRATGGAAGLERCDTAPILITPPQSVPPERMTRGRRIAAALVHGAGTMTAVVTTSVIVVAWIVAGQLGVLGDPYPFPFLVFVSSLVQLAFMLLIMVGQDVLGEDADRRSVETAEHTAVVLQQCRHLRQHLREQDAVLSALMGPEESAPPPRSHEPSHRR